MRAGAAQKRGALLAPVEQLQRVHRHDAEAEVAPLEREVARVREHALDRQLAGVRTERREQLRVSLERGDGKPRTGEEARDATGAGAVVEDRPAGACPEPD